MTIGYLILLVAAMVTFIKDTRDIRTIKEFYHG